jgi:hypothetical protein
LWSAAGDRGGNPHAGRSPPCLGSPHQHPGGHEQPGSVDGQAGRCCSVCSGAGGAGYLGEILKFHPVLLVFYQPLYIIFIFMIFFSGFVFSSSIRNKANRAGCLGENLFFYPIMPGFSLNFQDWYSAVQSATEPVEQDAWVKFHSFIQFYLFCLFDFQD